MTNDNIKIGDLFQFINNDYKRYFNVELSNIEFNDILMVIEFNEKNLNYKYKLFNITKNIKFKEYRQLNFYKKL